MTSYFYKQKEYLDVGKYGFSRNVNKKYSVDYSENEFFKNTNIDVYCYDIIIEDDIVLYLDENKKRTCKIFSDYNIVRIDNGDRTGKCYKVTNNLIYDNNFKNIKMNINTGDISIKLNGSFIKFDKDENIISKLNIYSEKMEKLEEYIEKHMNDIKSLINFDTNLKIGNMYLVNENNILQKINDLKNIKELYDDGLKLLNYEHDEKIKREIATGLNEFCKKRIGPEEAIVYVRTTSEGKMISKLIKLNNGYYTTLTSKGLIEIDVNLYKDITIAFNNNLVFKIEYGEIQYISKILMDIMIDINNKIDKELAKQDKINKHNEEIEKQNGIKRLEKRLKELKNN